MSKEGVVAVEMGALLVMAFTNSCRVYTVHTELKDVTEEIGFDGDAATVFAASTSNGMLIQVMHNKILFVDEGGVASTALWHAPAGCEICVATCCENLVLCSTSTSCDRSVYLLDAHAPDGAMEALCFSPGAEASALALLHVDQDRDGGTERWLAVLGTYRVRDSMDGVAGLHVVLLCRDRTRGWAEGRPLQVVLCVWSHMLPCCDYWCGNLFGVNEAGR